MSFEDGLFSLLSGDATLVGKVGSRIYPVSAPQGADYPHVILSKNSAPHEYGLWDAPVLRVPVMEVECMGQLFEDSRAVANRVIVLLDRLRGDVGGVQVITSLKVDEKEDTVDFENGKVYRTRLWFRMTYQE